MTKHTERLPLQFFFQRHGATLGNDPNDEDLHEEMESFNSETAAGLKSIYQSLWAILSEFANRSKSDPWSHSLASRHFFEPHEVSGHPNVYLQCKLVDDKWLALIIEQKMQSPSFAGQVGLVLGGGSRGKTGVMHGLRTHSTLELDLLSSIERFRVHKSALEPHAEDFLADLVASPSEVTAVQHWFQETERVIAVPEASLRETSKWLSKINREMAEERAVARAAADSQNEAFMLLYTSLANPRMEV